MKCVKVLCKLQSLLRVSKIVLAMTWQSEVSWMSAKRSVHEKKAPEDTEGELCAICAHPSSFLWI